MKDEYIGRNALLSIITTKFNEHYGNACYQFIHDFYRFVIRKICAAPAADVVEVRHGRWLLERTPDGKPYCFHCSVCDDDFHHIGIMTVYDYCPNCGAYMMGESNGKCE